MKHTLKDIDQFFDAARREAPMLDDQDFAAMLDRADAVRVGSHEPLGSAEVMRQSPTSRFGSGWVRTAINHHRGMIMTGFGLTAVAGLLITGAYLSSPDETKQSLQSASVIASSVEPTEQVSVHPKNEGSNSSYIADSDIDVATPLPSNTPRPNPLPSDSSLWVNVKIEGVKPLVVTPEEIEVLGITAESDGRVYFAHQTKDKSMTIRTSFPMELSINRTSMSSNAKAEEKIAPVMPTMVTDSKGKKLAFFFVTDSAGLNFSAQLFSSEQHDGDNTISQHGSISNLNVNTLNGDAQIEFGMKANGTATIEEEVVDENGVKKSVIKKRPMMKWEHDSLPPGIQRGMAFQFSDERANFPHEDFYREFDSANFPFGYGQSFDFKELENFDFQELENMDLPELENMDFGEFDFSQDSNFKFDFDFDFDHKFDFNFEFDLDSLMEKAQNLKEEGDKVRKKVMMIRVNTDSLQHEFLKQGKGLNEQAMTIRINADSIRRQALEQVNIARGQAMIAREQAMKVRMNMDSIRRQALEQVNSARGQAMIAREQAMKMRVNGDSIRRSVLEQLNHLKLDSLPRMNGMRMLSLNKNIIINRDSSGAFDWSKLPKPVIIADFRKQRAMIDKLVPVQVLEENQGLTYNKNGLIFWYMPDEKFSEVAPESMREASQMTEVKDNERPQEKLSVASKAGVIADPLVYPNPSPGRSTFKYTLDEPRAVSIAVHDLLGKQVMMVANAELKSAGTFEKELDFSSLDAGVYLLVMVTDKGEQATQRVVLER